MVCNVLQATVNMEEKCSSAKPVKSNDTYGRFLGTLMHRPASSFQITFQQLFKS